MPSASQELLTLFGEHKVIAFEGEMGSGKTTLIKAICNCLNVVDNVSSPTFAIVNEYFTEDGQTIYHFDFYRLKNLHEAMDIGAEEYFYSGSFCLIEWPDKVEDILPEDTLTISIKKGDASPEHRIITVG